MTRLKRTLKDLFKAQLTHKRTSYAERYLAGSCSLEEVERRQRELTRMGL